MQTTGVAAHRNRAALVGAAVLLLTAAGCGSDKSSGPGNIFSPAGTGSGTMLVTAEALGSDDAPGSFETVFNVFLADTLGLPVSGATVQIATPGGTVILTEGAGTPGTYAAARTGYASGIYTLSATRGTDWVSGVQVRAPEIHSFTTPQAGDTVAAGQSLAVRWTRVTSAQEVNIESRDYESPAPELDDGSSLVPASGNPSRDDQRIRVFRKNRILLAGGLPGSRFEARIRNTVEPVIAR